MKEMLEKLENNGGLTLVRGKAVNYKTGWQVADYGAEAVKAIEGMNGNCGVWLSDGIFYIDHSFRVNTKAEALRIGREHNQISVLNWRKMALVYC